MMMRFLLATLFAALAIFFATPMALVIVDAWCYVALGHAVTGIEWNPNTGAVTIIFLIPAALSTLFAVACATD